MRRNRKESMYREKSGQREDDHEIEYELNMSWRRKNPKDIDPEDVCTVAG
jgi:hypothetical protein